MSNSTGAANTSNVERCGERSNIVEEGLVVDGMEGACVVPVVNEESGVVIWAEAKARGWCRKARGFGGGSVQVGIVCSDGLCSQAVSGYSEASIAASAIRSTAALEASGVGAWSSWLSRARSL